MSIFIDAGSEGVDLDNLSQIANNLICIFDTEK